MTIAPLLVRPLADSRPPGWSWHPVVQPPPSADQPTLDLNGLDRMSDQVEATLVRSRWCARQDPRLPDARTWSTALAVALVEALHARRPVAQLNRWVDDDVLTAIFLHQRRRRTEPVRLTSAPTLRSVRVQHPHPEVAEVSAHVSVMGRSVAMAFRLEALTDRWLCAALELGPRS